MNPDSKSQMRHDRKVRRWARRAKKQGVDAFEYSTRQWLKPSPSAYEKYMAVTQPHGAQGVGGTE